MASYAVGSLQDGCYPDTAVLINLLDIRNQADLDAVEGTIVPAKAALWEANPLVTSFDTFWQKQGWPEPEIVENFNPDRTTLVLPLAANKVAAKSGDKKVAERLVLSLSSARATFFSI